MRTETLSRMPFVAVTCVLSLLFAPAVQSQSVDSSTTARPHSPALQFDLIRDFGVYYIGAWGSSTFFRIGVDLSYSNESSSGTTTTTSNSTTGSNYSDAGKPDNTTLSYAITVTGYWIQTLAEYGHSSLYVGAGPMVTYSRLKFAYSSSSNQTNTPFAYSTTESSVETTTGWGFGPAAVIGIRARIVEPVSVTAELNLSALHEWTTSSSTSTDLSIDSSNNTNTITVSTGSSDMKGWTITLDNIRIGIIVDL